MKGILYSEFENNIIITIQQYMSGPLVKIASLITELGDELAMILVIGLVYWCLNKKLGKKIGMYLSLVNIIYPCIKSSVKRLRPYMADSRIKCLKPVHSGADIYDVVVQEYSFPSGHASNSIAVYGSLMKVTDSKILRILLPVVCLLIGVSRFALGVHYPSDVLAGWLISGLGIAVFSYAPKKLGRNRTLLLFGILGLFGFLTATTNDFYTGYGLYLGMSAGFLFEEKYVRFKETRSIRTCILRTLGGTVLFLILNTLLKLPFSAAFLDSGTKAAFLVRTVRYAAVTFLLLGVYPMSFRLKFMK